MSREIVVGVTGASGSVYAIRLLRALREIREVDAVHLVFSRAARLTMAEELGIAAHEPLDLEALAGGPAPRFELHDAGNVGATIASGSHRTEGMVVLPCSAGTVGRIANGVSDSLLTRAADVCLKEGRRLVLVVRETPLSRIHLRNLLAVAEAGATVMPPVPAFYAHPRSVDDIVDQLVARVLDHFALPHRVGRRWSGLSPEPPAAGRDA